MERLRRSAIATMALVAAGMALAGRDAGAEEQLPAMARQRAITFTAAQAEEGRAFYLGACASCHGANLEGGAARALKGRTFLGRWSGGSSLGALYGFIRDEMPPGGVGTLGADQITGLIALILSENGEQPGAERLPGDRAQLQQLFLPFTGDTSGGLSMQAKLPPWPETSNPAATMAPVTDALLQAPPQGDWLSWRRTLDGQGFSPLSEVNRGNVRQLRLAWSFNLAAGPNASTPLVHDGVMFVYSNRDHVDALNAATGELLWSYRRELPQVTGGLPPRVKRNMALYGGLLLLGTADEKLLALDAMTGGEVWATDTGPASGGPIAVGGMVVEGLFRGLTMPPRPSERTKPGEGMALPNPSCPTCGGYGRIFGVEAESGELVWTFNVVPQPGEAGTNSWNDIPFSERSGGSVWTTGYYDPALDLVFIGTGNTYNTRPLAKPVGKRGVTNDALYTDSTLALNPATGKLAWYYQHHARDLWDLDWVFERMIVTLEIKGKPVKSLVTIGKTGILDALDAASGKYLFSLDAGFQNVITGIDPATGRKSADDSLIPGDKPVVICPAAQGAKNWIPGSYDPASAIIYQPVTLSCLEMVPAEPGERSPLSSAIRWSVMPRPDSDGRYGQIVAYDLKSRSVRTVASRRAPMTSGVLATAGGLVFAGGLDRAFSAFDSESGKLLWSTRLGDVPSGAPISFAVNGKQYIAVVTGYGTMLSGSYLPLVPEIPVPAHASSSVYVFELP